MAKELKNMSADEIRWQTDEDVKTLERYQEIMNDSERKKRVLKAANEKADNLKERANALSKNVTGIKGKK